MSVQLFTNAKIFTPVDRGVPCCGPHQNELAVFEQGMLLIKGGEIIGLGNEEEVSKLCNDIHIDTEHDCHGRCLIPGFVDPHTHICFAELREVEFAERIGGTPYLEILEKGGGILSSVKSVHEASVDDLIAGTRKRVLKAMELGTTSLEIKSGYGLDTQNELKILEAIDRIGRDTPVDVVATFLGAHAIPPEYRGKSDDFIAMIIAEMLPEVKKQGIAGQCDVFCEKGVFTIEQGRRLLNAARDLRMGLKLHADEVHDLGGAGLAAELKALSADHLLAASDENIRAMADAGVVANLLPATAYSLRKEYARARTMIDNNLAVALATDCNPGSSFTESMQFVIGLAVMNMRMTPAEALTAATLNSAYAIGLADKAGSLDLGKQADFLILDGASPVILAYHAGVSSVAEVYKNGVLVAGRNETQQ